MFARRTPRTWAQKLREAIWPSMGFQRLGVYYLHRVARLNESPAAVARGFAAGAAIACTPFVGFHLMLGGLLTWALRGSMISMVIGSVIVGNVWTYPFLFMGSYKLGMLMLGHTPRNGHIPEVFTWGVLLRKPMEYLWPMTLGSLPLALAAWVIAYYIARQVVQARQAKHRAQREIV